MAGEQHAIKMPGSILDQIRDRETRGDYDSDKKYRNKAEKKRKSKEMSRKDKRKEERATKKAKHSGATTNGKQQKSVLGSSKFPENSGKGTNPALKNAKPSRPQSQKQIEVDLDEASDEDLEDMDEESTWDALKALKNKKNGQNVEHEARPAESDVESEDDFGGFSDDEEDEPQTAEDVFAALKAAKAKKSAKPTKDVKASKSALKVKKEKTFNIKTSAMIEDEKQIDYYAKKLGISKNQKLHDTGDGLDSLLDGLDFDFESNGVDLSEEVEEDEVDNEEELPFSSDDDLNSSDFDEDEDGEDELLSDSGDEGASKEKENPYAAPTAAGSRYIPPALRRKMAEQAGEAEQESEEVTKIKRSINGSLNKLSDANFISIVNNELNALYTGNPRQVVTECLTDFLLNNIKVASRLLDSFVIVYAGVVSALYRLQGIEFAAYFIQKFIETMEAYLSDKLQTEGKELMNLISLFAFIYNFNIFSSHLIFDVIKSLCVAISEDKIEMLLRTVVISGQKMRAEDPASLREIISLSGKSINEDKTLMTNTRAKFLLETLQNVKNNKFKTTDQGANNDKIITSLKKQQLNLSKSAPDPIQVTLDDIHDIETKGKWWLVGAAWKGHDAQNSDALMVNEEAMNDIIDSATPNWADLADFYRMNTSVRRAIFIAIMSSEDYEEAAAKVHKLGLKGSQKFEVPKILLICCSVEAHYNPFYGLVAKEFCKIHDMRKTFQFNLWDLIKEFEGVEGEDSDSDDETGLGRLTVSTGNDEDEDSKLKKILSLGKLYGFLIGQGSLPLAVLKTTNFITATEDTKLFLEVMLVTFLDNVAKLSEKSTFGTGLKKSKAEDLRFDDARLVEKIPKDQPTLLKGLQDFLRKKVKRSEFITGRKQKRRVEWGCDTLCDAADELLNLGQY